MKKLIIDNQEYKSRLILGTGKYKDFEGRILEGYGKGDMKIIVNNVCDFLSFKEDTISFKLRGSIYLMFKPKKKFKARHWLIKKLINKR